MAYDSYDSYKYGRVSTGAGYWCRDVALTLNTPPCTRPQLVLEANEPPWEKTLRILAA